jgi:hypothetical protein
MNTSALLDRIKEMPPDIQQEIEDFADFILKKRNPVTESILRQEWAGALSDFKDRFSSLELQEKALEWRND